MDALTVNELVVGGSLLARGCDVLVDLDWLHDRLTLYLGSGSLGHELLLLSIIWVGRVGCARGV